MDSVERWLGRVAGSRVTYLRVFRRWLWWLREMEGECSPGELLMLARRDPYAVLDLVQEWVRDVGKRISYRSYCYAALRSFFLHNRVELPRDPGFRLNGDKPPVRGNLTLEGFRRILMASNRLYRAVFLCMFQAGMGCK